MCYSTTVMDVPEYFLEAIRGAVGPKGWIGTGGGMEPYLIEERGLYRGTCDMVVLPRTTAEVAAVVGHCARAGVSRPTPWCKRRPRKSAWRNGMLTPTRT